MSCDGTYCIKEASKILMKDAVNTLSSSASKKDLSPRPRDGTSLTIADIESKIDGAAERRETFLATKSSSSKRVHSPRPGPSASLTVEIIEEKLNSAAERREIYLKNKVSRTSSKSSPDHISKTLSFSSVSPPSSSPRIKAARLDTKSKQKDIDPLPSYSPWLLSSFAVALLSMMAFARFTNTK